MLKRYPIHHARESLTAGFVEYGNRCVYTPIVFTETRIYIQVAAYLQIPTSSDCLTVNCKLRPRSAFNPDLHLVAA